MEFRYSHLLLMFLCSWVTSIECNLRKPLNGTLQSSRLGSGPVFLIDSKTILVTKFSYDNGEKKNFFKIHNKWFKGVLRRGDNVTSYVDLQFLNATNAQLTANLYLGLNIYLHVPDESQFDVRHFSAIAIVNEKNATKTKVSIDAEDLLDLPEKDDDYPYKAGKFVFVYPKCCPINSYYQQGVDQEVCVSGASVKGRVQRIPLHDVNNNNQYQNPPMLKERVEYVPFYYPTKCANDWQIKFEQDVVTLLSNFEVIVKMVSRPQVACMEFYLDKENVYREAVYVCVEHLGMDDKEIQGAVNSSSAEVRGPTVLLFVITFLVLQ